MGLLNITYYTTLLRFFILIVTVFFFNFIYACTWTTTGLSSNWTNASAWTKSGSGCGAATYPSQTSINTGDVVIINHTISLTTSTYTVKSGGTLTINSPATFSITGNIDINNGSYFQLNNGASLSVSGNFNNSNNSTNVIVNGSVNVGGNLTVGNGSSITSSTSSGTFTVQGSIGGAGTIFGSNIACADAALPCLTSSIAPLPVEFDGASLVCLNQGVLVEWTSNSEFNNDFYTLEISKEGTSWSTYANVPSYGNTINPSQYRMEVQGLTKYVRLIQTDKDGKQEILTVLNVNCVDENAKILIYPNPATDIFHVDLTHLKLESNSELLITDLFGKTVFTEEIIPSKSTYTFQTGMQNLTPGTYVVSVKESESIVPQRFITR